MAVTGAGIKPGEPGGTLRRERAGPHPETIDQLAGFCPFRRNAVEAARMQRSLSPSDAARAAMMAARRRRLELGCPASRRTELGSVAAGSAACGAESDEADLPNARRAATWAPNSP
jgi:hypothetical protein